MSNQLFHFSTDPHICEMNKDVISLDNPSIQLFDKTAQAIAKELAKPQIWKWNNKLKRKEVKEDKNLNKITQLRKVYDEICMWDAKSKNEQAFSENLPFIKMLNAKVAYARGREYVDDKFVAMFSVCMGQINEANKEDMKKFKTFKIFFEAFYGFYRSERV